MSTHIDISPNLVGYTSRLYTQTNSSTPVTATNVEGNLLDGGLGSLTIPANGSVAYALGTAITFINMTAAVVTIAITTDTMYLSSTGTTGSRSLARYGSATAIKMTSTTWLISGSGLS